jgi:hypothetical protein
VESRPTQTLAHLQKTVGVGLLRLSNMELAGNNVLMMIFSYYNYVAYWNIHGIGCPASPGLNAKLLRDDASSVV